MKPTIMTAAGRYFPLLAPTPADIHIEDIAHALANPCRFTGGVALVAGNVAWVVLAIRLHYLDVFGKEG